MARLASILKGQPLDQADINNLKDIGVGDFVGSESTSILRLPKLGLHEG